MDTEHMFQIYGQLENSTIAEVAKHRLILPSKHALTRLVVLYKHVKAGGKMKLIYTLMKASQMVWMVSGIACVKRFLNDCSICTRRKATPVRQLMASLPTWRVTATNKFL